jgi:hypothetical protein
MVAARWYQTFHNNHPILRAPFRGHIFSDMSKEGWNHSVTFWDYGYWIFDSYSIFSIVKGHGVLVLLWVVASD